MPRINDDFLDCVVYLYPDEVKAAAGEAFGGSGFLVSLPVPDFPDFMSVFVVTNKHVINGGNTVVRMNTKEGKHDTVRVDDRHWIKSAEDDLAIAPITIEDGVFRLRCLSPAQFVDEKTVTHLGPGDETFVVGRFVNHEGKQKNTPTVRFGMIAQMPGEKIRFDDGSEQESFLVEARSIAGYSGSPVFVYIPPYSGGWKRQNQSWMIGPWLLGIDHCHVSLREPIRVKGQTRPLNDDWYVRNNTGMMGVIPAWKLVNLLQHPDVVSFMEQEAEGLRLADSNKRGEAIRDAAHPEGS